MHSKSNYPAKKFLSNYDVELNDNTEDKIYLEKLKFNLNQLNQYFFDYVFYIAGVDIHYNDRLGKLKKFQTMELGTRDQIVTENFFHKEFLYVVF